MQIPAPAFTDIRDYFRSLDFWKILEDYDVIELLFKLNGEVVWKFLEVHDVI